MQREERMANAFYLSPLLLKRILKFILTLPQQYYGAKMPHREFTTSTNPLRE